jgi:hypothetical protein
MNKIDLKTKLIHKKIDEIVWLLENDGIKSGDIVYCTKECSDVIFLEMPDKKFFSFYHERKLKGIDYVPFAGDVKYQTFQGKIKEAPIMCIIKISEGNISSSYQFKGKDAIDEAEFCEYLARGAGFRVERKKIRGGYILKFFGDSKEELDDFIMNCCNNKNILWD